MKTVFNTVLPMAQSHFDVAFTSAYHVQILYKQNLLKEFVWRCLFNS